MSRALRAGDVLELSKIYEAEFNKAELHDRVLVFDVIRDGWEPSLHISNSPCDETKKASQITEELETEYEPPTTTANEEQDETVSSDDLVEDSQKDDSAEVDFSVENESEIKDGTGNVLSLADINSNNCEQSDSNPIQVIKNSTEISSLVSESSDGKILRQHRFFIHGSWLAVQSTYFRSLLFLGMKESNCKEVHMKITESEEKAHLLLLEALYKVDILDGVDVDELLGVLLLAHKYDAKFVFKKCKYCLQAGPLSLEICENIMSFIKVEHAITDVEDLTATLQSFLAKEFSPLDKSWQTISFENLSQPSLKYLLSSDELMTQSENTVFHALMHWLSRNNLDNASNEHDLASLVSVIRFELMPIDYLYNTVQHHPIATKMPDFNHHYLKGVTYHAFTAEMRKRLKVKPINRVAPPEDIVHYTWIMQRDKLDKLDSATDEELKSDPFWCCGYKMHLYLKKVSRRSNRHLGLQILGLANESVVWLKWIAVSDSFDSLECEHTFNAEIPMSSCAVYFALQNHTERSSPQLLSITDDEDMFGSSTSAFTFGSAVTPLRTTLFGETKPTAKRLVRPSPTFSSSTNSHVASSEELPCLSIDLKVKLKM